MDCLKWWVMSLWSYLLSLLLPKPREATCGCCLQHYSGYRLCTRHSLRKILHKIIGCTAAMHCAEGWSSHNAINLHRSWTECEWGFQQGGSVLPSWQLEYLKPAEVEARKNMQVRDRLSCRIGGSEAMSSWRMAIYSPPASVPASPHTDPTPTLLWYCALGKTARWWKEKYDVTLLNALVLGFSRCAFEQLWLGSPTWG